MGLLSKKVNCQDIVSLTKILQIKLFNNKTIYFSIYSYLDTRGGCGRDRMVVGFTATCAISGYHH
jgi:hypothetical protein